MDLKNIFDAAGMDVVKSEMQTGFPKQSNFLVRMRALQWGKMEYCYKYPSSLLGESVQDTPTISTRKAYEHRIDATLNVSIVS
jgi:hypothetical protein